VRLLPLDLSGAETLEQKASEARRFFGRVDVMVHNGGVSHQDLVTNTSLAVDRTIMETNYFGTVALTKALLPPMLAEGKGHFVVVGSLSGKFGVPRLSAYSASKHALHGFFESLRAEVAGKGIRITIVIPGIIRTPITVNALTGDGTPHGKMTELHEKGMSPEACAERIIRAVAREQDEALIGGKETLTVMFHRLFPGLFVRVIRNHPVKRWRKLTGKPGGGE
jgi:short-subunit dehydrogenase